MHNRISLISASLMLAFAPGWLAAQPSGLPVTGAEDIFAPRIILGTDRVVDADKGLGRIQGAATSFKFEEAPIVEVAHVVLRDIAKVDYVLHQPIAGTVTLATRGEVSADQAVLLFEAALQANGLQMARDSRGVFHIGKPDVLRGIVPSLRQATPGIPLPPGYGAIVVPLMYIGAGEMATILRPMTPPDALVRVDTVRNLLVLVGSRNQAEGWLDVVKTFDVDFLKGMSVGVFPLKHASTKDIEAALRLLASSGVSAAPATGGTPTAAGAAAAKPAANVVSGLSESFPLYGALRVLPIERLNSVLVVSPRAAYLDEARAWIEKLDRPSHNASDSQLFVYPVQNGSAGHLAGVLGGLFGTAGGGAVQQRPVASGVAPGLAVTSAATVGVGLGQGGNAFTVANTQAARNSVTQAQTGQQGAVTLEQGVRLMADEINNAVLVYGPRVEYEKIEATLKRLDVPPTQVLIEASIVEVTLGDDLKYGLQWVFNDNTRNGLSGVGVLSTLAGGVLGGATSGFSYTLSNTAGNVRAVLNALAEKSLVKVISSPSLMVLDNHTASINVGNQQPIRSAETVTAGGNITSSIQYKDTGVSLAVTPSVNAGNMVTMQLEQAVTDVGAVDAATGQRSFLQRNIASKVAVRSGETLVLGGLIRDNSTTGKSGIPLLQDLPLVGNLFGTNTSNGNRTELLVVITPRVLRSDRDVRTIGVELRDKAKLLFTGSMAEPIDRLFDIPSAIQKP